MRFLIGILGMAAGFVLVWQANWITNNFGRNEWAEAHLGAEGGTRIMWKLIGLGVIILSLFYMFGFIEGIIWAIFSPLFRGAKL